ncbi:haloacid dehalogenase-like hydrolase domain protein, partial [Trifolium medium]|nr:haloacid dehalogenase-like hydrolase domain protein [Trifolium medium]
MGTTTTTIMRCSPGNAFFRAFKPISRNSNLPNSLPLSSSSTPINKGSGSRSGSGGRAYDALLLDAGGTLLQLANPVEETYATIGSKYGYFLLHSSLSLGYIT